METAVAISFFGSIAVVTVGLAYTVIGSPMGWVLFIIANVATVASARGMREASTGWMARCALLVPVPSIAAAFFVLGNKYGDPQSFYGGHGSGGLGYLSLAMIWLTLIIPISFVIIRRHGYSVLFSLLGIPVAYVLSGLVMLIGNILFR